MNHDLAIRRRRRRSAALFIALLALSCALPVLAQGADDLEARANAAIQAADWIEAARLYGEVVEAKPDDGAAWYRLGLATIRSGGQPATARKAFERALELGFAPVQALLGVARTQALDGEDDAVLQTVERLAEQGPSAFVVAQLSGDAYASLAEDARFKALIKRLTPCASDEYRQFDFWLGSWNVVSPQGQPLGTNTITESLDGCMLIENWESAAGGQKGMSINYYDRDRKIWAQIFRDNSGNISRWPELNGNLVDGAMVLESAADAQPRTRWTWTPQDDGRVRQMAEASNDGGESWNVVWDSYYVPVGE